MSVSYTVSLLLIYFRTFLCSASLCFSLRMWNYNHSLGISLQQLPKTSGNWNNFSESWQFQNALIQPPHLWASLGSELETIFLQNSEGILLPSSCWWYCSRSSNCPLLWKWMNEKALPPQLGNWWLSLHSIWQGDTAISLGDSRIHKCFLWGCSILTEKPCS